MRSFRDAKWRGISGCSFHALPVEVNCVADAIGIIDGDSD